METRVRVQFEKILASVLKPDLDSNSAPEASEPSGLCNYEQLEKWLRVELFVLGRLFIELFLASARRGLNQKRGKASGRVRRRQFKGFFGAVTYWREGSHGHFPLDNLLGIAKGGFSHSVCLLACNLATRMSFAVSAGVFGRFAGWSPDPGSIENMVLGIGAHAPDYMEQSAPLRDADTRQVLVIEIDGKAPPTATECELKKRSAKARERNSQIPEKNAGEASNKGEGSGSRKRCCCQRHRAKAIRHRARKKKKEAKASKRRHKGKKSKKEKQQSSRNGQKELEDSKTKNGRSATLVVTYVLEQGPDGLLHGPKDKRVWADFGPRVNMMQWAKEEALRRGFDPQSKDIHLVMDGEKCLREGMRERFPGATIALDIRHAEEHLHALGKLIYPGSKPEQKSEQDSFVENYRAMLYDGEARKMTQELQALVDEANKQKKKDGRDPNDGEYQSLEKEIAYFASRLDMMDYGELKKKDLVIASGQVEGAARHLIGERMDCGGMRWKVERARLLMHLRCIEINGEWEKFDAWLSQKNYHQLAQGNLVRRTSTKPPPMPPPEIQIAQAA